MKDKGFSIRRPDGCPQTASGAGVVLRLLPCLLSCLLLCFLMLPPAWATEPSEKEPKKFLPNFRAPLHAVLPNLSSDKDNSPETEVNNALPGLGTLQAPESLEPSLGRNFLGGSLELTMPFQKMVPAIYIEGEGYLPLTHPGIQPYLDPAVLENPQSDPSVIMIPEGYLDHNVQVPTVIPEQSRTINVSGNTVLSLPAKDNFEPIVISAATGWKETTETHDIHFLEGDCSVRQANSLAQGPRAVVWIEKKKDDFYQNREVTVYMEGGTQAPIYIESAPGRPESAETRVYDQKWLGRFSSLSTIEVAIMAAAAPPAQKPAIFQRALTALSPEDSVVRKGQYTSTSSPVVVPNTFSPRFRRLTLNSRRDNEMDIAYDPYPNDPSRGILVITKGLNLIIDGVQDDMLLGSKIDISADNAVVWMSNPAKLGNNREHTEESNKDFELYLEGNIIFRDESRRIEAHRMYYDAKNNLAYILEGRLDTPILGIKGITGHLRLKADILQQLGEGRFSARNALVTTSQLGQPTYSLRSRTMTLTEKTSVSSFGRGEPVTQQLLVAENNYLAAQTVPVFYWPWMAADLKDPTFYIKSISYGNSSTYGNKVSTVWNPFQLLNIRNRPSWLDGDLGVSWLEKRGITHGTKITYKPSGFCTIPGNVDGSIHYWGLSDKGVDRLGGLRKEVEFPHKYRYEFLWRHRQEIASIGSFKGPWTFSGQVGKVSDKNVINSFHSSAWQMGDNYTTSAELEKKWDDSSASIFTEYALDDGFTNANWLPRLDHYILGRSLLKDRLTWYGHTRVGYMDYNTASAPYDWMNDGRYFRYLPWELTTTSPTNAIPDPTSTKPVYPETINMSGEVFSTRHELDLPFNVGPVRVVPFAMGDFSHWGTDRGGNDVQRFYGRGGVRLNLPFWKVLPKCSSRTWYVNGLAHKVDFNAELSYAKADQHMDNLVMTDALDTWSTEEARRLQLYSTFGSILPEKYDPRYFAVRSNYGGNVSASNMELVDDLTLCRFGVTQRWQTKRGPVGNRHIIDWVTLSTHFNLYPDTKQNYGKSIGLIDYDFLWHVGDRFSLFSSGLYDLFEDGLQLTRVGTTWQRPERGNISLIFDQLSGKIQHNYITLAASYVMNDKYSVSYSTSFQVKTDEWIQEGHNFCFTRTGESFRLMIGANYNESRDEWGISFGIEPVFMRGIASKMQNMSTRAQEYRNER